MLKELLASRTEQIIPTRLLQRQIEDGFQEIIFDDVIEQIPIVQPQQHPEESERSYTKREGKSERRKKKQSRHDLPHERK